jgi:predicted aldo/keto reductase-like oxidoreductase
MPNLTILMSNVDAALKQTRLSSTDRELLKRFAWETKSSYCAGCAHLCESAMEGDVPISDVMRYLMYYHSYGDRDRARELFGSLSEVQRRRLRRLDFTMAERKCPHGLEIGRLMGEAVELLG